MSVESLSPALRQEIVRRARLHGATRVRLFGSFARGEARSTSDVDLLVDLEPERGLLDIVAIKQDLESLLQRPVDVLTEASVSRYIRDRVIAEAIGIEGGGADAAEPTGQPTSTPRQGDAMNRDELSLRHMLDAARAIIGYTAVDRAVFLAEPMRQDAVVRQLQVLGEAVKRVSPELRARHARVAWQQIGGLRNILVHDYEDVDLDRVWRITQADVPDLAREAAAILAREFPGT